MNIDDRQLAALGAGLRRSFEKRLRSWLGELFGDQGIDDERVREGVAAAVGLGLRSCRAVSSYLVLTSMAGEAPQLALLEDESLGPPDARMEQLLVVALRERYELDHRRAAAAATQSLAPLDETVVPATALEGVQLVPRGAHEKRRAPMWRASGPLDAPGQHWVTTVTEGVTLVEAKTRPADEPTWERLAWLGGAPIADYPSLRRVPRDRPAHHRLVAALDDRCDVLHLWVVSATGDRVAPPEAAVDLPSTCRLLATRGADGDAGLLDPVRGPVEDE